MKADRSELIKACRDFLQKKTDVVLKAMNGLKEDLDNESKSSAGDKYETGREMINIEWNKLSNQLNEYEKQVKVLNRIEDHKASGRIVLGSIVNTEIASYFISIPAGEISIGNEKFYAVGIQAPVAQKLLGKEAGEHFEMNAKKIRINSVN
ncbi:transcription elongation factor [Gramella jeungdoensis]|uniref:Transcription elongation factor n=1 Tax=Gramella jeungdoensis TaxID=708091 RepID=A0ABT0Z1Y2_9FLAO|nr:transcription elongation factor [Gramella jeungdoensis]MCM8569717.1 transcription elongation factor [Gramella jeungdoensis]